MIQKLANDKQAYEWIDIESPEKDELQEIAQKFSLHAASVNDALQPDHLPKYERLSNYTFIILRIYHETDHTDGDTLRELTSKIAVFIADHFIITIHRLHWPPLEEISKMVNDGGCEKSIYVLGEIVKASLASFDEPGRKLTEDIEYYEKYVFLRHHKVPVLKQLYFIKRKVDVIKRLLVHFYDVIDKMDKPDAGDAYTRDIRDLYIKQQSLYDALAENTNHLLNIYFNISSQRTNETMRILTIFSVFFMPLTFIVGIYGMNFKHMPELEWAWSYPAVMILMALVVVIIYVWFKRKKWL